MTVNEQIVTGRKFRKLIDEATKLWQRISFWTKSSDVEFDDGKDAETKIGAIDGITDSLVSTSSRIAASAKAVNTLSNNLAQQPEWIRDSSTGKITGYRFGGADPVFPFSELSKLSLRYSASVRTTDSGGGTYTHTISGVITYDGNKWTATASGQNGATNASGNGTCSISNVVIN